MESSLTLNSGAYFQIDSAGGICGHHTLAVSSGALLIKYGILELDTLLIPGGVVNCIPPGIIVLTQYGIISNGGSFSVTSGLAVGPWFNCVQPKYSFATGIKEINNLSQTIVFPNPASKEIAIMTTASSKLVIISNAIGKPIRFIDSNDATIKINVSEYSSGFYFYKVYDINDKQSISGKFIVSN